MYDFLVERRQNLVMRSATRSNAIVSSLFPSTVRDQLYQDQEEEEPDKKAAFSIEAPKRRLASFLHDGPSSDPASENGPAMSSKPIAELFSDATVIFADIAGFT